MMGIGTLIFVLSLAGTPLQTAAAQQGPVSTPPKAAPGESGASFNQVSQAAARARDEGRDNDAVHLYPQALALRPGWKEGLWSLSKLLYQKEQYPEARDVLRRFVAYDP